MSDHVQALVDERQNAFHQAKEILDRCVAEKRERTAEENEMYDRASADMARLKGLIDESVRMRETEADIDTVRAALEPFVTNPAPSAPSTPGRGSVDQWFRTQADPMESRNIEGFYDIDLRLGREISDAVRAGASEAEVRALYSDTGSSGSIVPTTFVRQLYAYLEETSALRQVARVFQTAGGETMEFPRVGTHAIGTQVIAQGTAIGGTDPVFEKMQLGAFKYGQLVGVSRELLQDSGVDILSFLAQDLGYAVGRVASPHYVTGNGTSQPEGFVTAAGTGVKTGGSLIPLSFDHLISLTHSIASPYRSRAAFVMNDETAGSLMRLRAGAGDAAGTILGPYLWQPSLTAGEPDRILGYPVYTDFSVATQGSAARAVGFGDFSTSFYIRDAGSLRVERSDEYGFNTDTVYFRAVLRTDSGLIDGRAVKTTSQLP